MAQCAVGGADGGAFATAGDLDRFLRAFDAGMLTGPALRDAMLTPHSQVEDRLAMGYGVYLYGYGDSDGRARRFGHGGGDPGCAVLIQRLPELDANTIALRNVEDFAGEVRDLLVEAVLATS